MLCADNIDVLQNMAPLNPNGLRARSHTNLRCLLVLYNRNSLHLRFNAKSNKNPLRLGHLKRSL